MSAALFGRKLLRVVVILVVIAIVAAVALVLNLNRLVRAGVERGGTRVLDVPVGLDGASVGILRGTAGLDGFAIGSPEGFAAPRMFYLGHAHVTIQPFSVFSNQIVVHEVVVDGAEVMLEFSTGKTNWGALLARLQREPSAEEQAQQPQKTIRIDRVSFTNCKVGIAGVPGLGDVKVPLPNIVITEGLSTAEGKGVQARKVITAVAEGLCKGIFEAVRSVLPTEQLNVLAGDLGSLAGAVSGAATEAARQGAEGAAGAVKGGAGRVGSAIGGIFGGGADK